MNQTNNQTVLAIVGLSIAFIFATGLNAPNNIYALPVHKGIEANDIQPTLTYQQASKLLDSDKSYEDQAGLNLQIQNTKVVAVYSNEGANGNFVFQYMVTLK